MKYLLGKTASMFIASGLIKIAGGIAICLWPINDFTPLVYLFGIPAIIQGFLHITTAVHYKDMYDEWRVLLLIGSFYLIGGAVLVSYPNVTPKFLMIAISITWLLIGMIMVLQSIRLNKESQNEFGLFLSGVLSMMAGVYLLTNLHREVYSILWIIVIYSFLIGILTILFGIKARAWQHMYFDDIME
jgi:uncharacterized membrane protein HdeD (DUF308 family)